MDFLDKNEKSFNERPYLKVADMVNSPAHYTQGKVDVIEIIEEAISMAETPVLGMLQGQVLKYILRMWLKDNPEQDAEKAEWYLTRLIEKLKSE